MDNGIGLALGVISAGRRPRPELTKSSEQINGNWSYQGTMEKVFYFFPTGAETFLLRFYEILFNNAILMKLQNPKRLRKQPRTSRSPQQTRGPNRLFNIVRQ